MRRDSVCGRPRGTNSGARTCRAAGVEPEFKRLGSHYDERKILDYIWSANGVRQNFTADQVAAVGVLAEEMRAAAGAS